jgi:hypothetical protein
LSIRRGLNQRLGQKSLSEAIKQTCIQAFDIAVLVDQEVFGGDAKLPWIVTEMSRNFTVSIVRAEDPVECRCQRLQFFFGWTMGLPGPLRPWIVPASLRWWLGKQLKVGDAPCPMSHGRSNAIVSGISTTDNNHVFALGVDEVVVLKL